MPDQTLSCKDCRNRFTFNEQDQALFFKKRWPPPVRCKSCRERRRLETQQKPERRA